MKSRAEVSSNKLYSYIQKGNIYYELYLEWKFCKSKTVMTSDKVHFFIFTFC